MKVERNQPGFTPVTRRFTQVDVGNRIGATAELAHRDPDERDRRKFDDDEIDDGDVPSSARAVPKGMETRLLNITA